MFNNSSHIAITRGTFNIVHGNQYNIYDNHAEADGRMQFSPEDEWKIELYREYKRVSIGDCNLLRMMGESTAEEYEYEDDRREEMTKATRVFSVARLGGGRNGSRFMSVGYTGRDAKKLFKQDCIAFSQTKHASTAQLHAFNDSANPMLFFHDELIPLQHIIQSHPDCRYALLQYIAFQHALMSPPPFFHYALQTWIRPQDGTIVYGPEGPPVDVLIPYVNRWDFALALVRRHPAPALPLSLYESRHLVKYLASSLLEGFIPPPESGRIINQPLSFSPHLAVLSVCSASSHIIATFPEAGSDPLWNFDWPYDFDPVHTDDGWLRYQFDDPSTIRQCNHVFRYGLDDTLGDELTYIWFAQACHVFKVLGIPREDWEDYGFIYAVHPELTISTTHDTGTSPSNKDGFQFPVYLFVRPCLQLSDGFPDLVSWSSSTDLYYWSADRDGLSKMTEEELVRLDLPCYAPKVTTYLQHWLLEDYDFMRDFQEAKGFDPTTTDFARSIGVSILEVVVTEKERFEPEEDRFKFVSDNNDPSISPSRPSVAGNVMDMDVTASASHCDKLVGLRPPEGVEEMDVDMEDCPSQMEGLAVDISMEVDD
ncbi:hypothetical protein L218DRAFT_1008748 [Marasmius fiardii PR-910]|nr:hypothetical protein L218DRAFT_1008748 [Marasmius fiardii PR-910]